MSAVKRMPRYAVVPMNNVRRNMEGYPDVARRRSKLSKGRADEQKVSSIQDDPGGS